MSNLSNSVGEGGGGGWQGSDFTDTGYGTHEGAGNVPTGAQWQKGTGYDEHGQVATSFGRWPVAYDPVTGMAVENVTGAYDMGGAEGVGDMSLPAAAGLVDVSAAAPAVGTEATPEMQAAVQEFFMRREQQQQAERAQQEGQQAPPAAGEAAGQGEGGS
ncbi:acetylcholinesterase precursor [Micractinium conductrix]|uniref:Acetylcholinesterase n=1 Tax=Micractinium conductrix TaxID=554055 RepID=A0A2P6VRG7_9CHLO|nr:acetylcholinesterase precursor [Micractinium conductrix]|eukprot:PSC76696.1 acetylcholinesterase precursor [Micractinium conductrix]